MKEHINSILGELASSIKDLKGFTKQNAPELAKEIVNVGAMQAKFGVVALSFTSVITGVASVTLFKVLPMGDAQFFTVVNGVVSLITLVGAVASLLQLLSIRTAPKMYVLEKLRQFMEPRPRRQS